jgi:ribosomal protein S18 acetylase RimI-like enzyme
MKQHIEKIWGWDQTWQETNFSQSLDKYITFTLHIDNERAGYIQFEHTSEFTFLSMIVLDPSHQSKGYGVEVLKKIQELDPERPIKLRCFRVNESAYNFYIKNGFKEIESDQEFQTLVRGKDA